MKRVLFLVLLAGFTVSCQVKRPHDAKLSPTGAAASVVYPGVAPTITLSSPPPGPGQVVIVRQTEDLANPVWTTVTAVTDASSIILPITSPRGFYSAIIGPQDSFAGQQLRLAWDYPEEEITPDILFNVYWEPDGSDNWIVIDTVPWYRLTTQITISENWGRIAVTASNSTLQTESDFSNILSWSNSVGKPVPLRIVTR